MFILSKGTILVGGIITNAACPPFKNKNIMKTIHTFDGRNFEKRHT